ncbi:DUF805 domain-containing protein [Macrococcus sp. EM39E]|uniref:DUF805 domain-containing protein n=1 Tax=Macrococcus animalis TaxID=3395467 RepID=UPI0039BEB864
MERDLSIKQAVISFWKNGFKFSGRSRRSEYWLSLLGHVIIFAFVYLLFWLAYFLTGKHFDVNKTYYIVVEAFTWIAFIPGMAIGSRRLQDINISGIYCIIVSLISIPLSLLEYFYSESFLSSIETLIGKFYFFVNPIFLIASMVLFIMSLKEGTRGPNKYGADPKYSEVR